MPDTFLYRSILLLLLCIALNTHGLRNPVLCLQQPRKKPKLPSDGGLSDEEDETAGDALGNVAEHCVTADDMNRIVPTIAAELCVKCDQVQSPVGFDLSVVTVVSFMRFPLTFGHSLWIDVRATLWSTCRMHLMCSRPARRTPSHPSPVKATDRLGKVGRTGCSMLGTGSELGIENRISQSSALTRETATH